MSEDEDDLEEEAPEVEDRRAEARRLYPWLPADADVGLDAHLDADGNPRIVERRFDVGLDHVGWRLDHYLKAMIPRLSRTRIQAICVDHAWKPAGRVADGDVYTIRSAARPEPPCPRRFTILADDPAFVVVDKPAGLPVHASAKFYFNTLVRVMSERFGDPPPQICHRLDRETSGALVCAKTREAAAVLKGAFAAKRVRKAYLAITHGTPDDQTIDVPLALAGPHDATTLPGVRMLPRDDGLPSTTRITVVERAGAYALVRCEPITGRQHQIRAHLAHVGAPIVGDKLYTHGDEAFRRFCDQGLTPELARLFELPRQALHAHEVVFPHPLNREDVRVVAPLPPELRDFLDRAAPAS